MKERDARAAGWRSLPGAWLAAAVFVFAFALYANTLNHGYVLDDESVFWNNAFVQRGFGGIGKILTTEMGTGAGERNFTYRPLVLVTFAVEKALFGNRPIVGHGLNVALYAGACSLLFLLLAKMLGDQPPSVPLAVTLLFAAHPAHVEVVANIKSREEILCFLFLLGLLWSLLRSATQPGTLRLALGPAFFALALLTKEHAITFLALVPLTLYFFSNRSPRAIARSTVPYVVLAGIYLLLRRAIVGAVQMPIVPGSLENTLTLTHGASESLGTRLLILWNYLRLLVFPLSLSWDYSYNVVPVTPLTAPRAVVAGLVFLGLTAVAIRDLKGRRLWSYGILFFLITFAVVSNVFLKLRWTMAERFLFTPSLGASLAAVVGVRALAGRLTQSEKTRRSALSALLCTAVLLFSARTFARNRDWRSDFDLSFRDAATHPQGARIHHNLGVAYERLAAGGDVSPERKEALLRNARDEYQRSLEIYPNFVRPYQGLAYVNWVLGDLGAAERACRSALKISPVSAKDTNLLALILFQQGRYREAEALFKRTLVLSPSYPQVDQNLAATYARLGLPLEAVHHMREAARKDPSNPEPLLRLAEFHRLNGQIDQARSAYEKALALRRDEGVLRLLQELNHLASRGGTR